MPKYLAANFPKALIPPFHMKQWVCWPWMSSTWPLRLVTVRNAGTSHGPCWRASSHEELLLHGSLSRLVTVHPWSWFHASVQYPWQKQKQKPANNDSFYIAITSSSGAKKGWKHFSRRDLKSKTASFTSWSLGKGLWTQQIPLFEGRLWDSELN